MTKEARAPGRVRIKSPGEREAESVTIRTVRARLSRVMCAKRPVTFAHNYSTFRVIVCARFITPFDYKCSPDAQFLEKWMARSFFLINFHKMQCRTKESVRKFYAEVRVRCFEKEKRGHFKDQLNSSGA